MPHAFHWVQRDAALAARYARWHWPWSLPSRPG